MPRTPPSTTDTTTARAAGVGGPRPSRILLVEDDEDTRQLLAVALGVEHYHVDQAADADQALTQLRVHEYDLVLTDYDLPDKTGATLLTEGARLGLLRNASALVVTAHPQPQGVEGMEVMRKPLDLVKFLGQIRQVLAERPVPDPSPACEEVASAPASPATIELVLYVSSRSLPSLRARQKVEELVAACPDPVRLSVCDLAQDPSAGDADGVIFTPTLVKRAPAPRAWLLGDFSATAVLRDVLQVCGLPLAP